MAWAARDACVGRFIALRYAILVRRAVKHRNPERMNGTMQHARLRQPVSKGAFASGMGTVKARTFAKMLRFVAVGVPP